MCMMCEMEAMYMAWLEEQRAAANAGQPGPPPPEQTTPAAAPSPKPLPAAAARFACDEPDAG